MSGPRSTLSLCAGLVMLAGCALPLSLSKGQGDTLPIGAERTPRNNITVRVLYSFKGGRSDGQWPFASLLDVKGKLYGTTPWGGLYCRNKHLACGTVFDIPLSGAENVLYRFKGPDRGGDGADPYYANLIEVQGTLYGTTYAGGAHKAGTVFAITASGSESVLYSFGGRLSTDGNEPFAGLTSVNGRLYGTTAFGGAYSGCGGIQHCGTVFEITRSGKERILHSFGKGTDGKNPFAGLVSVAGILYGTTCNGGEKGLGTVFAITPSGKERVLHSFGGNSSTIDGACPMGGLVNAGGTLYGDTSTGGPKANGTVFSITPSGQYTVVYNFQGYKDGSQPRGTLVDVNGTLYGTTVYGGYGSSRNGTVYAISGSGQESVVYRFGGQPDGSNPMAGLIDVNGTLYGTTAYGGSNGRGTVFSITP